MTSERLRPEGPAPDPEARLRALMKVVSGQAAMIALLVALLEERNVLTREECLVILSGGVDAQDTPNLEPGKVVEWSRREIAKRRRPPRLDPPPGG